MDEICTTVKLAAKKENLSLVNEAVQAAADKLDFDKKSKRFLAVACDEIFSNIAKYAYPQGAGYVEITVQAEDGELMLSFSDTGIPFNPLKVQGTDLSVPPDQRPVGQMGIQIVRELAKSISYTNKDGLNVLTVIFVKAKE